MDKGDLKEEILLLFTGSNQITKEELLTHFEMDKNLVIDSLDELIHEGRVVSDGTKLIVGKKIFIEDFEIPSSNRKSFTLVDRSILNDL